MDGKRKKEVERVSTAFHLMSSSPFANEFKNEVMDSLEDMLILTPEEYTSIEDRLFDDEMVSEWLCNEIIKCRKALEAAKDMNEVCNALYGLLELDSLAPPETEVSEKYEAIFDNTNASLKYWGRA